MDPFATHDQVAGQWRPLSPAEQTRATALLAMAAVLIRREVPEVATAADGSVLRVVATQVSIDMVIEAMAPGVHRGKSSYSVALDGATDAATLTSTAGTVALTPGMLLLFGRPGTPYPVGYFGDCPP